MSTRVKEGTTEIARSIRWRMDLNRDWKPLQPEIHILHRGKTGLSTRDDGQFELTCSPETQAGYNTSTRSAIEAGWIEERLLEIPAAGTPCTLLRGRRSSFPEDCHKKQVQALKARSVQIDGGPFLPQEKPDRVAEVIRNQI